MNSLGNLLSGYFLFWGIVTRSKMFKTSVIAKVFVYLFQVLIMLGFHKPMKVGDFKKKIDIN